MVQYEIRVEGRVQGVCFRYFVREKAIELGITGWVKNTSDGSVQIMAQGKSNQLELFFELLARGPVLARVKQVIKMQMPSLDQFNGFIIKY
ncbi:MAG: acylphosphatase [Mariniphaga sp.]|nr:acylphosphatase [Mariniphaga sp.]